MKPASGDIVIFHWPTKTGRIHDLPAIITHVYDESCVNLSVLNNGYVSFDGDNQACKRECWSPRRT